MDCDVNTRHHHLVHYENEEGIKYTLSYPQMGHYGVWENHDRIIHNQALAAIEMTRPDLSIVDNETIDWSIIHEGSRNDVLSWQFGDEKFWDEIESELIKHNCCACVEVK